MWSVVRSYMDRNGYANLDTDNRPFDTIIAAARYAADLNKSVQDLKTEHPHERTYLAHYYVKQATI